MLVVVVCAFGAEPEAPDSPWSGLLVDPPPDAARVHFSATVVGLEIAQVAGLAPAPSATGALGEVVTGPLCATPCTVTLEPGTWVLAGRGGGGLVRASPVALPKGDVWVHGVAGVESARTAGLTLGVVGAGLGVGFGAAGFASLAREHTGSGTPLALLGTGLVSLLGGGAGFAIAGSQRGHWEVRTERWADSAPASDYRPAGRPRG